jgi:anti-sigma regulatory factor (Ser/Thr protein kinase)
MTVKPDGSRDSAEQAHQARYGPGADFPHTPESVGEARRILGRELRQLDVAPSAADDAVLILSELVSNALRHARPLSGGTIRVAWSTQDSRVLRIAVTDGGGVGDAVGPAEAVQGLDEVDESAVDGRGLGIVGALAEAWGVDTAAVGDLTATKTVWAVVRIHARHAAPHPPDKHRKDRMRRLRFARQRGTGGPDDGAGRPAWVPRYPTVSLAADG